MGTEPAIADHPALLLAVACAEAGQPLPDDLDSALAEIEAADDDGTVDLDDGPIDLTGEDDES